jgi:ketosteroid isomerase-like protein
VTGDAIAALATAFFDAVEAGDLAAVRACYAPDARIWHNTDDAEQTVDVNIALLAAFVARTRRRRYADRRLAVFAGGFVQQHRLIATRMDASEEAMPAAIVCRVEGGLIQRLDEYFDAAQVERMRLPAAPQTGTVRQS